MNMKNKKKASKIIEIIAIIILIIALMYAYDFYQSNNFNEYLRSELNQGVSEFKRDKTEKTSEKSKSSYKITSSKYNDAIFAKKIKVTPNTPYKVSCMVKTKDVKSEENKKGVGAQISISDTTERSIAVTQTNQWQQIELIFNSKNRTEIDLGFRLGGYLGSCSGTAWFSDFTLEEGIGETSNQWNFACFVFKTTDVNIDGKEIKINVNEQEKKDITETINSFTRTATILSRGKMETKCDIYDVSVPIDSLSFDKTYGYYVAPEDIEEQIKETIKRSNYDHIFIIVKLGNETYPDDIQIGDWIGLGSMDYYGIGFSNIRLPNDSKNYIYKYDTRINTFPEEVFLHEFLHSLERTSKEYGYERPELHDFQKYGYKNERLVGQKKWYTDYMNKEILNQSKEYIGLPPEVYTLKPAKSSNFQYAYKKEDVFKQPQNFIEEIKEILNNIGRKTQKIFNGEKI